MNRWSQLTLTRRGTPLPTATATTKALLIEHPAIPDHHQPCPER